jgi:hypothetical protein
VRHRRPAESADRPAIGARSAAIFRSLLRVLPYLDQRAMRLSGWRCANEINAIRTGRSGNHRRQAQDSENMPAGYVRQPTWDRKRLAGQGLPDVHPAYRRCLRRRRRPDPDALKHFRGIFLSLHAGTSASSVRAQLLLFQLHPYGVGTVPDRSDRRAQLGDRATEQVAPVAHLIVLSETHYSAVKSRR